ncbi:hypothetical protein H5410_039453 [Solanum commersonii]|uniref:Uncharacterized protein n=1 Tax=Solanum commersonii TaxID=4109 RepID=A0A9J5XKY9_SOLCO|nr:hypothetical protein H5410_039453 [Solanum commersonii]
MPDWTCKVQIVDIRRHQENTDLYKTLQEQLIKGVVYGDDIVPNSFDSCSTEFDILEVVLHCEAPKYAGRIQISVERLLLSTIHYFGEIEGFELQIKMKKEAEFHVSLESVYEYLLIKSKFSSTMHIKPTYPYVL